MLNRHRAAAAAITALGIATPRVLDIGARDGALAAALPGARVTALDTGGSCDLVAALPCLPFADRSFDAVAALDVLEHCDDLAAGFAEAFRIADRLLLASLPNMAHPFFRLRFALTGRLSAKYDLGDASHRDRHRWLPTLAQSDALMQALSARHRARLSIVRLTEGRRAAWLAAGLRPAGISPQLWAWTTLYAFYR